MKRIKKMVALVTLVTMVMSASSAFADDAALKETLQDAFYGGAIGSLVGAALMAFTKKPADHFDYIAYGAASGVLVGTAYGVAKSARAMASIENGNVKLAMPTIVPVLSDNGYGKETKITWNATIVKGTFN